MSRPENKEKGCDKRLGYFLIFIAVVIVLLLAGLVIWRIWSRIYTDIKREESTFDIEKEAYEQIKKEMKEEQK